MPIDTGRRTYLRTCALVGALGLAGCTSGGDDTDSENGNGNGNGGDENETDENGGNGENGNSDDDTNGEQPATATIGEAVDGEYASMTVEYVRSVDEVKDYSEFPDIGADASYGDSRAIESFQEEGLLDDGTDFYGAGVAVTNVGDRLVDVSTIYASNDDGIGFPQYGRSQRLTFARDHLLPGELVRAEVVFALESDISAYTMTLEPIETGTEPSEKLTVDLGAGTEADASYSQSPAVSDLGNPVGLGNFEITVHSAEFVDSVEESTRPEKFGSRPGYRYLLLDLSATRVSDEFVPRTEWRVGVRADDGYGFTWPMNTVSMYHDVVDTNRPRVDFLEVDETIEHTKLAFAIEDGFDPEYLTMIAPGPLEDPPQVGNENGVSRALWPIS